ncbi:glutathionylspermidine synthase [Helicobacter monodelphidis]|uniref:glutathionylspermidine synthase family protein n=1 Tax=Helicobacter sp. 15-1451 TaxID=2004995 RepID=UPI000DCBE527|nr:glutathionylspermidine synthase family protein [Helicobacter sp. 15-1451]RAX57271.1 glutathionylspermidine synthase [Helicobacter sp. 15-1451]
MEITKLQPISKDILEEIGFEWHTDPDSSSYIANEAIALKEEEAENYYAAANELYDMFIEAAQYVIDHNLFFEIGIPFNAIDMIKMSWEEDIHWHLYGRFDFAGGLDGTPIKLLEFNADTPTMLFESTIIQWALLKANGMDESLQFNNAYESLRENFKRLITLEENTSDFESLYEGWRILFSSVQGNIEEEQTVRLLEHIAKEAGFNTQFCYAHEAHLSQEEGLFYQNLNYEFWFKLIPWESIAVDEPDMASMITEMMRNKNTIFLNPAYTLLFQSKRILKILWDLFPNHPLLLETSFEPLPNQKQVKKHAFSREGENIQIIGANGEILAQNGGSYGNLPAIYQSFTPLNQYQDKHYQANVFYAFEACALGFRQGGEILDNYSKFVSHFIK